MEGGHERRQEEKAQGAPCPQKASVEARGEAGMSGEDVQCGVAGKDASKTS